MTTSLSTNQRYKTDPRFKAEPVADSSFTWADIAEGKSEWVDFAEATSELLKERSYQQVSGTMMFDALTVTVARNVTPFWSDAQTQYSGTSLLSEQQIGKRRVQDFAAIEIKGDDKFSRENSQRIALLARKFASSESLSVEDNARLVIATERVRNLLPAITAADYERLANVLSAVKPLEASANQTRDELRQLLSQSD